jgi:hypothetical protein
MRSGTVSQIAAEPYQTVSFKIQAREIDSTPLFPLPSHFFSYLRSSSRRYGRHVLGALGPGHENVVDAVLVCAKQVDSPPSSSSSPRPLVISCPH